MFLDAPPTGVRRSSGDLETDDWWHYLKGCSSSVSVRWWEVDFNNHKIQAMMICRGDLAPFESEVLKKYWLSLKKCSISKNKSIPRFYPKEGKWSLFQTIQQRIHMALHHYRELDSLKQSWVAKQNIVKTKSNATCFASVMWCILE